MIIYKYKLDVTDRQTVKMPTVVGFLSVQFQRDSLMLWALVDEDGPERAYEFAVIGTGNPINGAGPMHHIGTVQSEPFGLVWHVFHVLGSG